MFDEEAHFQIATLDIAIASFSSYITSRTASYNLATFSAKPIKTISEDLSTDLNNLIEVEVPKAQFLRHYTGYFFTYCQEQFVVLKTLRFRLLRFAFETNTSVYVPQCELYLNLCYFYKYFDGGATIFSPIRRGYALVRSQRKYWLPRSL